MARCTNEAARTLTAKVGFEEHELYSPTKTHQIDIEFGLCDPHAEIVLGPIQLAVSIEGGN